MAGPETFDISAGVGAPGSASIETKRESVRSWIAIGLLLLFVGTILFLFLLVLANKDIALIKEISTIVLPPISGLLGAVTGFYYGASQSADKSGE